VVGLDIFVVVTLKSFLLTRIIGAKFVGSARHKTDQSQKGLRIDSRTPPKVEALNMQHKINNNKRK